MYDLLKAFCDFVRAVMGDIGFDVKKVAACLDVFA
jgi:hypothetical protein